MTNRRISLKTLALGSCALGALMAGPAAAEQFAVPSQELRPALQQFATQGDQQVLFSSAAVAGKHTAGFSGEASPETALQALLAGTDLVWSKTGDGALLVKTRQEAAADPQSGSAAGDGAEGTVQALIVTAQKREENIQDVPIAMSAFTQEDLTRSQVATGADLMTQVPNMTFTKTNFSSYSIQIRGIGTQAISATTDPAVAVAFNNTPFIRNRFFEQEFYDLQRVEVLRGPQGTLYGRNATAGVVNLISQKPKFTYEAKLSADVANYGSRRLEGMLNIPLAEDKVALRIAGAWTKRDGFTQNEVTGQPIDGRDLWSTRVSLRVAPTDGIDANLIWEHFQEDDDRLRSGKQLCHRDARPIISGVPAYPDPGYYVYPFSQGCLPASLYSPDSFEAPNGLSLPYRYGSANDGTLDTYASSTQSPDLRVIESTYPPQYRAKSDLIELQVSFDVAPGLTLSSETSYDSDFIWSIEDYNRFTARPRTFEYVSGTRPGTRLVGDDGVTRFCDPQLGCQDHIVAVDLSTANSSQFSQEFRLASNFGGKFNFSLGANFLRYDTMEKYYVFINSLTMRVAEQFTTDPALGNNPVPYSPDNPDNYDCLQFGMREPNPNQAYDISCAYIDPNPIGQLNDQGHNYFLSKNPYKLISYAVFGEAYYNITDALKLTAGLRFGVDKKSAPRIPSWIFAGMTAGYPVAAVIKQEWREPTGRLALDWKPHTPFTEETLVYASYAHGYKAGGANPPAAGTVLYAHFGETGPAQVTRFSAQPQTFEPEFVDAFEVGTKNTLLDGKLTLNADAFYYDYAGYQISQIINRSALNSNLDSKVWGAEIEADWRPVENLRLGFKGGYENTRVSDGQKLVDVMDRTGGRDDWVVVRPFPSFPSNCIVPLYTVVGDGSHLTTGPQVFYNGNMGPCEFAYVLGLDPVSALFPDDPGAVLEAFPGYPGFDPLAGTPGHPYTGQNIANGHDYGPAPNGGAGFDKDLSGHELPNAPHFTATVTADYTIPLPSSWLMTLHTDLYYQSEAWTRVFNTPGYDKLKAFSNVNVAAIFSNEDAGWKVMAYVKNVFDKDNITGAFLNSDDTGLTTNVFLVEPRLYGLRVTKEWTVGPWWTGANANHTGPYPLTVELGGEVQRFDAPRQSLSRAAAPFPGDLNTLSDLNGRDFDIGDGGSAKVTWRPNAGLWGVSVGVRYGRTNQPDTRQHTEVGAEKHCLFGPDLTGVCSPEYHGGEYYDRIIRQEINVSDATSGGGESYKIADFQVGRDFGIGVLPLSHSSVAAGLRYAQFDSTSHATIAGIPDHFYEGALLFAPWGFHRYEIGVAASRDFHGLGPALSWDAAVRLLGNETAGHLDVDWSLSGGILFGRQHSTIFGSQRDSYFHSVAKYSPAPEGDPVTTDISQGSRSRSATVPTFDATLGLSYEIQRVKIGAGYRWERYFNVLDVGYSESKDADRTIDGPYFKIAVGFGG